MNKDEEFKKFCKTIGFRDIDPEDRPHIHNMRCAWDEAWSLASQQSLVVRIVGAIGGPSSPTTTNNPGR